MTSDHLNDVRPSYTVIVCIYTLKLVIEIADRYASNMRGKRDEVLSHQESIFALSFGFVPMSGRGFDSLLVQAT